MEQATFVALIALVALTVLIGLPICMLVKRTRAYRVTPSTIMGKQDTENASLATTADALMLSMMTSQQPEENTAVGTMTGQLNRSSVRSIMWQPRIVPENDRKSSIMAAMGSISALASRTRASQISGKTKILTGVQQWIPPLDNSRPVQEQIVHQLKHLPMFENLLDTETLLKMAESCKIRCYEAGEHIVVEGELGDSMYIIKSGHVSVTQSCTTDSVVHHQGPSHIELARLGPLQFFGEMSLLIGEPRAATATAMASAECVEVRKEALFGVLMSQPQIMLNISQLICQRQHDLSLSQVQINSAGLAESIEKHFQMTKILNFIRKVPLFQSILDDEELVRSTASRCELARFDEGATIVHQGACDENGSMYIIETGTVSVNVTAIHCDTGVEMGMIEVARMGEGDTFGEMSLILGDPRTATIRAITACECICVTKQALLPVLISHGDVRKKLAAMILSRRKDKTNSDVSQISDQISQRFDLDGIMHLLRSTAIFEELAQQESLP